MILSLHKWHVYRTIIRNLQAVWLNVWVQNEVCIMCPKSTDAIPCFLVRYPLVMTYPENIPQLTTFYSIVYHSISQPIKIEHISMQIDSETHLLTSFHYR